MLTEYCSLMLLCLSKVLPDYLCLMEIILIECYCAILSVMLLYLQVLAHLRCVVSSLKLPALLPTLVILVYLCWL